MLYQNVKDQCFDLLYFQYRNNLLKIQFVLKLFFKNMKLLNFSNHCIVYFNYNIDKFMKNSKVS